MKILADDLKKLFKHCVPSTDDLRFQLSAVRIEDGQVVSTDGHRIHVIRCPEANGTTASIPAWAIRSVLDAAGAYGKGAVEIKGAGDLHVTLSGEDFTLNASIGRTPFPQAWKQVLAHGVPYLEVSVLRSKAMLAMLRKAVEYGSGSIIWTHDHASAGSLRGDLASDAGRPLEIKREPIFWRTLMTDRTGKETLGEIGILSMTTKPIRVGVKLAYLIDALAAAQAYTADGDQVTIGFQGPLDPIGIKSATFEAAVMPLNVGY